MSWNLPSLARDSCSVVRVDCGDGRVVCANADGTTVAVAAAARAPVSRLRRSSEVGFVFMGCAVGEDSRVLSA
jgi:hypothetical protein